MFLQVMLTTTIDNPQDSIETEVVQPSETDIENSEVKLHLTIRLRSVEEHHQSKAQSHIKGSVIFYMAAFSNKEWAQTQITVKVVDRNYGLWLYRDWG